jgi:hypothetical protein
MTKTYTELAELGRARFQELTRELHALIVAFPDLTDDVARPTKAKAKRPGRKRGHPVSDVTRERMRLAAIARHAAKGKANGSGDPAAMAEPLGDVNAPFNPF